MGQCSCRFCRVRALAATVVTSATTPNADMQLLRIACDGTHSALPLPPRHRPQCTTAIIAAVDHRNAAACWVHRATNDRHGDGFVRLACPQLAHSAGAERRPPMAVLECADYVCWARINLNNGMLRRLRGRSLCTR